jgi:GTPase SAR1 family protein
MSLACPQSAGDDVQVVLLGNKCDLTTERVARRDFRWPFLVLHEVGHLIFFVQTVSKAEGDALARKLDVLFFETSALTSDHVEEAFLALARRCYQKFAVSAAAKQKKPSGTVKPTGKPAAGNGKGGCC